ncbi:unnamed protein product [Prorocentrum cordatum]|uniref:Serine protease n=1 Tax=Prorocentrum cordatum TaxID=2364126 RepID=A0ABN9U1C5_9DINO|nr:unnamed protein product [Polarella glacialis]
MSATPMPSARGPRRGPRGEAARRAAKRAPLPCAALLGALLAPLGRGTPAAYAPPPTRGAAGGRRSALFGGGSALLGALPPLGGLAAAPGAAKAQLTPQELRQIELFARTSPGVVSITEGSKRLPSGVQAGASGSAFMWDREHVVTNFHVIGNMVAPRATFLGKDASGNEIRSSHDLVLVGGDPLSDIAVLQVPTLAGTEVQELFQPLQRASSADLVPGQEVFALGNPYGLEHSMSLGVISAVKRTMRLGMGSRPMDGVIQTDAAINPGNSGGPLLDSEGRVVGMNSAIMSASGGFSGARRRKVVQTSTYGGPARITWISVGPPFETLLLREAHR